MLLSKQKPSRALTLLILLTPLLLCSIASRAQTKPSSLEYIVICDEDEHPDWCSVNVTKGQPADLTGVAMTHSMAKAYKATLDEAVAKLAEEKRYCEERLTIERSAGAEKLEIEKETAKSREALIQQTLEAERKNSQSLAAEIEKERAAHWLWGAGGVAAGVVTSLAIVGGVAVYATVSSALP